LIADVTLHDTHPIKGFAGAPSHTVPLNLPPCPASQCALGKIGRLPLRAGVHCAIKAAGLMRRMSWFCGSATRRRRRTSRRSPRQ
jgi:hypothetical protein